jgi:hypothetical protein
LGRAERLRSVRAVEVESGDFGGVLPAGAEVECRDDDGGDSFRLFSCSCFLSFSFARRLRAVSAVLRGEGDEERGGGLGGGALAAEAEDEAETTKDGMDEN